MTEEQNETESKPTTSTSPATAPAAQDGGDKSNWAKLLAPAIVILAVAAGVALMKRTPNADQAAAATREENLTENQRNLQLYKECIRDLNIESAEITTKITNALKDAKSEDERVEKLVADPTLSQQTKAMVLEKCDKVFPETHDKKAGADFRFQENKHGLFDGVEGFRVSIEGRDPKPTLGDGRVTLSYFPVICGAGKCSLVAELGQDYSLPEGVAFSRDELQKEHTLTLVRATKELRIALDPERAKRIHYALIKNYNTREGTIWNPDCQPNQADKDDCKLVEAATGTVTFKVIGEPTWIELAFRADKYFDGSEQLVRVPKEKDAKLSLQQVNKLPEPEHPQRTAPLACVKDWGRYVNTVLTFEAGSDKEARTIDLTVSASGVKVSGAGPHAQALAGKLGRISRPPNCTLSTKTGIDATF